MNKKILLIPIMSVACDACEVEDKNYPPIASATEYSTTNDPAMRDDATEGSESSSSTAGADTSTGDPFDDCVVERELTWLDENGNVTPTPEGVVAQYAYEENVGNVIVLSCGYIDDVPTCWVPCEDEHPIALTIEWFCPDQPLVHVVFDKPIPLQIPLDACSVTGETTDSSGTDSSGTDSSGTDSSGSTETGTTGGGTEDSGSSSTGV